MTSVTVDPSHLSTSANSCVPSLLTQEASIALSLFYTVLLTFSALGNTLALFLIWQKNKINSTDVYLAHLAFNDLLFTFTLPAKVTYYALNFNWPFGEGLCRLSAFIMYLNTYGGIYIMACISVDRYLTVVRVQQCLQCRTVLRARVTCVVVWTLASLLTIPLLLTPMTTDMENRVACMEYRSIWSVLKLPSVVLALSLISFCVPVGIMTYCYVSIALKLYRSVQENPQTGKRRHSQRACLLALVVLLTALLCFSPYHVDLLQFIIKELVSPSTCAQQRDFMVSLRVAISVMNLNCGFDPIIYFFASSHYRKWLLSKVKCRAPSFGSSLSSPSLGMASSETPNSNQMENSVSLAKDEV